MDRLISDISSTRPLVCEIVQDTDDIQHSAFSAKTQHKNSLVHKTTRARLNFASYELFGVLPYIIGVISLHKLEIVEGSSKTVYQPSKSSQSKSSQSRPHQSRLQHSKFQQPTSQESKPIVITSIMVHTAHVADDTWREKLKELVERLGVLIFTRNRHKASKELLERINADIVDTQDKTIQGSLVEISIDQLSETQIKMDIEGDDRPYMLYMICQALELLHISVQKITIATIEHHIHDSFVLDISNARALKHEIQQEIRVVILLTIQLVSKLGNLPSPREALLRFSALIETLVDQRRILDLVRLSNNPRLQDEISYVLGASEFIWHEFIQSNSLEFLRMVEQIEHAKPHLSIETPNAQLKEQLETQLEDRLAQCNDFEEKIACINEFKNKQFFAIDIDSLINKKDFRVFSHELSELARLVIRTTTYLIYDYLVAQYGHPMSDVGIPTRYALLGLGKFGGSAMGYASDLEVMLVYEGAGCTKGAVSISNGDFYARLMKLLKSSVRSIRSGIFKIDDRMRPYGIDGPLAVSLPAFIDYYGIQHTDRVADRVESRVESKVESRVADKVAKDLKHQDEGAPSKDKAESRKALKSELQKESEFRKEQKQEKETKQQHTGAHSSEKLALTRMRPVCGEPAFVEQVLKIKDSLLYRAYSIKIAEVIELRDRQVKSKIKLHQKAPERNAKFSRGALADLEYTIQILQVLYGQKYSALRQPSLHFTIDYLLKLGELSPQDSETIKNAYKFFRVLINALRMRRGNAEDLSLPAEGTWELAHLAKRIDWGTKALSAEQLLVHFDATCAFIRSFSRSLLQKFMGKDKTYLVGERTQTSIADIVYTDDFETCKELFSFCKQPQMSFETLKKCGDASLAPRLSEILLLIWGELERSGVADEILVNLARITNARSLESQHSLYKELIAQPAKLFILVRIFAGSRYLSDKIINNPTELDIIMLSSDIHKTKSLDEYRKGIEALGQSSSPKDIKDTENAKHTENIDILPRAQGLIRLYKNREILRIIARDLCLGVAFEKIVSEISNLAQSILEYAYRQSCLMYPGLPSDGIVILAMGKFGAYELNYSSDIDLICVYEDSYKAREPEIIKLIRTCIKLLSEYVYGGSAYRIDLRLRPFGVGSSIVSNVSSIEEYYKHKARLWELQALIKCRPVGGDIAMGYSMVEKLHAQLIRRTGQSVDSEEWKKNVATHRALAVHTSMQTSTPATSHMQDASNNQTSRHFQITNQISQVASDTQDLYEVKNSKGGIRDIEFGVQLLQILHTRPPFSAATIDALITLNQHSIIDDITTTRLRDSYIFLRRIEHFLQVYEDRQLHHIPYNHEEFLQKLAWYLIGESDADVFVQKLQSVKQEVHKWFLSLL